MIRFLGVWLITLLKLCRRWWCAMFNIHVFVLANFVMFVYLGVYFPSSILFWYQSFLWTFALRHFKSHMKILASTFYPRSHYPESFYKHSISNGIKIAKISFFSYKWCTSIFSLLFSYLASAFLWYNYSFFYNFLPIHSKVSIVFQTNECLNFRK